MKIKTIEFENFNNYKEPCMFIGTAVCSWKCCKENGLPETICQNHEWVKQPTIDIADEVIITRYIDNPYTTAIVFGGLEPFDQYDELFTCIDIFRKHTQDPIIIYTGYYKEELKEKVEYLKAFNNIIIKFGRFIPDSPIKFDEVLGVTLASDNQYAEKIS